MKELLRKILFFLCLFATAVLGSLSIPNVSAQTLPVTGAFSRNLTIGDFGGDVFSLQAMLIAENLLPIAAPTGYFGSMTAAAVAEWQSSTGLPSTGYFGPMSRDEIEGLPVAIAPTPASIATSTPALLPTPALSATTIASATSSYSSITYSRNLTVGDAGTDVASLQSTLISKGYLAIATPTGYFGSMTAAAVAKWQAASNIPDTGYFGPLTRASMETFVNNFVAPVANAATDPSMAASALTPYSASASAPTPVSATTPVASTPFISYGGSGGGGGGGGGGNAPPQPTTPATPPIVHPDTTPPTVPANIAIITTTSTVSLSWAASTDNTGVTGYQIFRNAVRIATATAASYKNIGLSPATSYSYTISAFDAAGNISAQSAKITAMTVKLATVVSSTPTSTSTSAPSSTPPAPTPPSIPQHLTITKITTSTVSLSWSASTESDGTISGYELYRNDSKLAATTQTSFTNVALTPSTTYKYAVASYDTNGVASPSSTTVTATTQALPPSQPPATSSLPVLDDNFGISVGSSFLALSTTTQNQELASMVSLGVGWIRFDMQWKIVQANNSSTYNWSQIDTLVTEANAHHLKMLAILDYAPAWAAGSCFGDTNCPPDNPTTFASFAKAAAQRYAPEGVTDYEIWNEPNNASFWGGTSNCDDYTSDLKAAYTAIKQIDSNASVITGGLAPESSDGSNIAPTDFLSCIYKNGGEGYFDAVGDHPYSYPQMPSDTAQGTWAQMSATTPSLRSIMAANGDAGKKIWITEFGAPTDGPNSGEYVTEAQQATMVTTAMNLYTTYSWAGPFFWYTLRDSGTATSTNENFFGLTSVSGSLKPAYTTLQSLISGGL